MGGIIMKIGASVRRALSALLAGAFLLSDIPYLPGGPADVKAASICTVDTDKTYQTIDGFGGMNLPEWMGSDLTDAQVKTAFGNGDDQLGLSILRIYVSDDPNMWSKAAPTAKRAQALGAKVFATPWNPPASIRKNGSGTLSTGKYQLRSDKWAEYAAHLNSFVKYIEGEGIDLYSVSVQNEPDYAEDWTYWSASDLTSFIAQYGKAVTNGTKAKLMSPESFQYQKTIYNTILNNSTAKNNIGVWGTHFYGTPRSWMDFSALENSGKPIWMTEVYVPNSTSDADTWPEALDVATNIHNGLHEANLSAYVWWYIRRSYSPIKENGKISKRGYCMAQFSKFVRPGDVRIDATEQPESGVYVSAYKDGDGKVKIVAVNTNSSGYSQQFSLGGKTITDVDRWRTSENENLAKTNNLDITDGTSFWTQLPAKSVSTFVVTTSGSSQTQDPEETLDSDGYYFHDTFEDDLGKWSAHGSTELSKSGRYPYNGKEAMLVSNRTSTWMGAERTLSSAFTPGTAFSFSVNVCALDGEKTETYYLKLNYKDKDDKSRYSTIAEGIAPNGKYLQLSNKNYTIPSDAKDMVIYVETANNTANYYIDEAIGAPAGKDIPGAGIPEIPDEDNVLRGDVNFDSRINIFDLVLAKRGLANGFASENAKKAADVDQSGTVDEKDIQLLQDWLLGRIKQFT